MPYSPPFRRLPDGRRPCLPARLFALLLALSIGACDIGTPDSAADSSAGEPIASPSGASLRSSSGFPTGEPPPRMAPEAPVAGSALPGVSVPDDTRFDDSSSSTSTADFTGRVNDDGSVHLSWQPEPGAAGYNVYRQGEYYTTVHEARFVDRKAMAGNDYRYEIHSFTSGTRKTFRKIASGLTVTAGGTGQDASDDAASATASRLASSDATGFSARVEDGDTVQLSWRRHPDAAGYNVYRQGKYHTTVHGNSFADRRVPAGSHTYEIHAFTAGERKTFWTLASGLTVTVGHAERSAPADTASSSSANHFVSADTPGFSAWVEDGDTVRLTWRRDPEATGYNVYYQGEYHTTVHQESFVDPRVPAGEHRYEIHAFTAGEHKTFRKIAQGLTVTIEAVESSGPAPDAKLAGDHELVFADEFDTGALDTTKWNTSYLWGPGLTINREEQYYVDTRRDPDFGFDPFTVDDGKLVIETIETPPALRAKANGKPYLSGVITSYDAFKFTYGYAEIRARMPKGRGYWTAFWLLNAWYGNADPEIDIVEFLGHEKDIAYHTYHYFDQHGTLRSSASKRTRGTDFTADFHTFGVDWRPGLIVYYVDGVETHRISDPSVSDQPMYLIANTALGGSWPGSPDASTRIPGRYEIDYIRVFRQIAPYGSRPFSDGESDTESAEPVTATSPSRQPSLEFWPEGSPGR